MRVGFCTVVVEGVLEAESLDVFFGQVSLAVRIAELRRRQQADFRPSGSNHKAKWFASTSGVTLDLMDVVGS